MSRNYESLSPSHFELWYKIFITGASRGIGLSIAKKCAADGYFFTKLYIFYQKCSLAPISSSQQKR